MSQALATAEKLPNSTTRIKIANSPDRLISKYDITKSIYEFHSQILFRLCCYNKLVICFKITLIYFKEFTR
ncbi:hypothetical protein EXE08_09085 [Acinetobacter pittii]|nr:hypothetical protein BVD86_06935 [Acinetobacter pittii]OYP75626.1 hypothetical protein CIL08_10855 [Acinetobacter sp. BS1]AVZ07013.1 hypothetical protein DBQ26_11895 [Acinetobacter pittii]OOT53435.1 hypothetical protein BTG92_07315 [Acinetobacter pittii]OTK28396.1 hypothetical protein B9X44_03085 [Acinetobacter pittii]